ncbi:cyclin-dependent kinase 4 inhibitor B isoform X1 [Scleropages formosus]|uniref:Cyclin-dependent kinase inhibitor 2A/B (p15, inhibits CDK4) n=1 Tax=Scleropages formosus TaxID=113540 RepID=A0A8C9TBG9_SCLFO|nr:cyclin-dependent kinase 4 inhibitor B-like isoform X1 [Scleropages formosus]
MSSADELASAAAAGDAERVAQLLQDGAAVDAVNRFGRTPLQVMMMGSTAVARLLLDHGANPEVQDSTGSSPLHDAAREGFLETVQLLCSFQANPHVRDMWNRRPIDLATEKGHREVMAFLQSL